MSEASNHRIMELIDICRKFRQGSRDIEVLKNISLVVGAGESIGLLGASGSGKSTMLQIAGLLEPPDSGKVFLDDKDTSKLNDYQKTILRREYLGFVYQFHHLLPEFSAIENVVLPQIVAGVGKKKAVNRGTVLLEKVGLQSRLRHRPGQLSGGEQQRVAIARALANKPRLVIADEPTGNLDIETGGKVIDILLETLESENVGAIIATHNPIVVERLTRTFLLSGVNSH
jgi:lipoprotein-releasing system ATP-binding protein